MKIRSGDSVVEISTFEELATRFPALVTQANKLARQADVRVALAGNVLQSSRPFIETALKSDITMDQVDVVKALAGLIMAGAYRSSYLDPSLWALNAGTLQPSKMVVDLVNAAIQGQPYGSEAEEKPKETKSTEETKPEAPEEPPAPRVPHEKEAKPQSEIKPTKAEEVSSQEPSPIVLDRESLKTLIEWLGTIGLSQDEIMSHLESMGADKAGLTPEQLRNLIRFISAQRPEPKVEEIPVYDFITHRALNRLITELSELGFDAARLRKAAEQLGIADEDHVPISSVYEMIRMHGRIEAEEPRSTEPQQREPVVSMSEVRTVLEPIFESVGGKSSLDAFLKDQGIPEDAAEIPLRKFRELLAAASEKASSVVHRYHPQNFEIWKPYMGSLVKGLIQQRAGSSLPIETQNQIYQSVMEKVRTASESGTFRSVEDYLSTMRDLADNAVSSEVSRAKAEEWMEEYKSQLKKLSEQRWAEVVNAIDAEREGREIKDPETLTTKLSILHDRFTQMVESQKPDQSVSPAVAAQLSVNATMSQLQPEINSVLDWIRQKPIRPEVGFEELHDAVDTARSVLEARWRTLPWNELKHRLDESTQDRVKQKLLDKMMEEAAIYAQQLETMGEQMGGLWIKPGWEEFFNGVVSRWIEDPTRFRAAVEG